MNSIGVLGLGLLLGLRHATDPDHVVAVTTIVSKQKKLHHAALVGIIWGIGHSLMILFVGILIIFFHVSIPAPLQLLFEYVVAIMLIVLGALNLIGILPNAIMKLSKVTIPHSHLHLHNHFHIHTHVHSFLTTHGAFHLVRPFIIGIIHGLAGSSAVSLLILSSISDAALAFYYLSVFGLGTVIGMMSITALISLPFLFAHAKFQKLDRLISSATAIVSIVYGIYYGFTLFSRSAPSFPVRI